MVALGHRAAADDVADAAHDHVEGRHDVVDGVAAYGRSGDSDW
mgnify:CR=1 FL=1